MYVSGNTERMAEAAKPFDIRHIVTGFRVYPAGFQSCFGPYVPMSPFWTGNVYILCHYM